MGAWIISGKNELKSPAFISLVFCVGNLVVSYITGFALVH